MRVLNGLVIQIGLLIEVVCKEINFGSKAASKQRGFED